MSDHEPEGYYPYWEEDEPIDTITAQVMIEELLQLWEKYIDFCTKQIVETAKVNKLLRKEYDKELKKMKIWGAIYAPPQMTTVYENPSFNGFIDWLKSAKPDNKRGEVE